MKSYKEFIQEAYVVGFVKLPQDKTNSDDISASDLSKLEKELDVLFASLNIDIGSFGKHFQERVNDPRNEREGGHIKIDELRDIFKKLFVQKKDILSNLKRGDEKVINDIFSKLNVPVVVEWNSKEKELSIVPKTVMRKKEFKTPNQKIQVK
jgi:hypothetical protein